MQQFNQRFIVWYLCGCYTKKGEIFGERRNGKKIIREKNRKSGHDPGSKRIFANQKLIPVMTAVLYFGKQRWKSPLRLHDMFELEENFPEEAKRFIEDHSMNLIQVAYLTVEERNRLISDFRLVAEYMAHQNSRESWNELRKIQ